MISDFRLAIALKLSSPIDLHSYSGNPALSKLRLFGLSNIFMEASLLRTELWQCQTVLWECQNHEKAMFQNLIELCVLKIRQHSLRAGLTKQDLRSQKLTLRETKVSKK